MLLDQSEPSGEDMMPNTIGIDDEDFDIIGDIEREFDIEVTHEDAKHLNTVGDVYDLLLRKIPTFDVGNKCASAMAFYKIRAALRRLGFAHDLRPTSDMRILEQESLKSNIAALQKETGLHLPGAVGTWISSFTGWSTVGLVTAAWWWFHPSLWSGIGAVFLGLICGAIAYIVALTFVDPGQLPKDCATFGEFARRVAATNPGRLMTMGARPHYTDAWDHLVDVLLRHSVDGLPKSEVSRQTYLLQGQS